MSSGRWLTHAEAADHLGLTVGSLRNRARSEGWEKNTNSEGLVIVLVPTTATPKIQKARVCETINSNQAAPSPELDASQRRVAELEAERDELTRRLDDMVEGMCVIARSDPELANALADRLPLAQFSFDRDMERLRQAEATPIYDIIGSHISGLAYYLGLARRERDQERKRADHLAGELAEVDQLRTDVTVFREMAEAERARSNDLQAQNTALRAQKDDRISLLERLIVWHRKSWLRKMFEEPPIVWLPGDRGFSR